MESGGLGKAEPNGSRAAQEAECAGNVSGKNRQKRKKDLYYFTKVCKINKNTCKSFKKSV